MQEVEQFSVMELPDSSALVSDTESVGVKVHRLLCLNVFLTWV